MSFRRNYVLGGMNPWAYRHFVARQGPRHSVEWWALHRCRARRAGCRALLLVLPVTGTEAHVGVQLAADRDSYLSALGIAVLAGGAFSSPAAISGQPCSSCGSTRIIVASVRRLRQASG